MAGGSPADGGARPAFGEFRITLEAKIMIVIRKEEWYTKGVAVVEGRSARGGGFMARASHRQCRRAVGHAWMYKIGHEHEKWPPA